MRMLLTEGKMGESTVKPVERKEERCTNCTFWIQDDGDRQGRGDCRRLPPAVHSLGSDSYASVYPSTNKADWCGEFEAMDYGREGE